MLVIRNEQLEALGDYMRSLFVESMIEHVAADFPVESEKMGDGVRGFIERGISKAAGFGIQTESDVSRFIDLMLKFGPDFEALENMAWAVAILQDNGISGSAKIDLIYQQIPAQQ